MDQPNPIKVAWSVVRVLRSVESPRPVGTGTVDHSAFSPVLESLVTGGLPAAADRELDLSNYLAKLGSVDPNTLTRDEALAYWLNLYNAGAVMLAIETFGSGATSVLRIPGGFSRPLVEVADEELSLDSIEHAKLRRFGDPRIHGALVCGSLSCPTLRGQPYTGVDLSGQLDDQMRVFLAGGGAVAGKDKSVSLSRVLRWFGSDFVRPHRMPTFLPASKRRTLEAVRQWLPDALSHCRRIEFQDYDWGLGCSIGAIER